MQLETIKVKRDGARGFHIINKSAFDPKVHQLHEEAPPAANTVAGPADLTATELKAELDAAGAVYKGNASKADLVGLVTELRAAKAREAQA